MRRLLLLLTALALAPAGRAAAQDPKAVEKQALGVIAKKCGTCHGPDGRKEDGIDYFGDVAKMIGYPQGLWERHRLGGPQGLEDAAMRSHRAV